MLWNNNRIQFARLISEIYANVEFTEADWQALEDSMDLSREEILGLFERADEEWQRTKFHAHGWMVPPTEASRDDPQPWRCVKCNEPVSHINRNACACTRALGAER